MRLYFFGDGKADGSGALRATLGEKGAELAQMARLGVPVPPGFTLPTSLCQQLLDGGWPDGLDDALDDALKRLGDATNTRFGDRDRPLIVSVRAGATTRLPGALKTILNVGLNAQTVPALVRRFDDECAAWDTYNRALQQRAALIHNVDPFWFEEEIDEVRRELRLRPHLPLTLDAQKRLTERLTALLARMNAGAPDQDARVTLRQAILAAVQSWDSPKARSARERLRCTPQDGVAINIQQMVFGNLAEGSGTGVIWTRQRHNGAPEIDGDFLFQAQGEEVEARTSRKVPVASDDHPDALIHSQPQAVAQIKRIASILESHYRDVQRIEFTLERGTLWVLETSRALGSFETQLRVAVDFVHEGLLTEDEALARMNPDKVRALLHPTLIRDQLPTPLTTGLATSPGAASGVAVFSSAEAERYGHELNVAVILITDETAPDDIPGVQAARGVIAGRGGLTSHAAVITRQMGKPSVVGCAQLHVDFKNRRAQIGDHVIRQGDWLTIDGTSGEIYAGELALRPSGLPDAWDELSAWADARRTLRIYANADSAGDARLARELGAEGIGLVRTEHMFFAAPRLNVMREAILAQTTEQRMSAMQRLLPYQRDDFFEILNVMQGKPVTIRLLDPPLHEFLPQRLEDLEAIGTALGLSSRALRRVVLALREQNPMLGHRGCRLAVSWPLIYQMQARAIFEAMVLAGEANIPHHVEILVPLVSDPEEMRYTRALVEREFEAYRGRKGMPQAPSIGSMIEVARACLLADEIAKYSDFISFGTNDLTQSVYGLSRDDASAFLPAYLDAELIQTNPFVALDVKGVGWFMELASAKARAVKPAIRIGLCGEQGSDPESVAWLAKGVVDYISCSPYRVPIARLAAGRSASARESQEMPRRL